MKAPFSPYLTSIKDGLKHLIALLREDYPYVSVLATDSKGLAVRISRHARSVGSETMTTERGIVVRVYQNGGYSEYALNDFDPNDPAKAAAEIKEALCAQQALLSLTETKIYETPMIADDPKTLFVEMETEELPETCDTKALVAKLTECSDKAAAMDERIVEAMARAQSTHISKLFLTQNRDLSQSYVYSEGTLVTVAVEGGKNQTGYKGLSGLVGPELFSEMESLVEPAVKEATELLLAEHIIPGEYDVITSPEVSGLIAHEAFGHGVEMDMFVKNRALGKDYIDKRVGSDLVTMHEGALCAKDVTSYAFDDEGTLAGDVTEIDHGILKTGICDQLAALRLGTAPTGNGKRENFEHKVYTRMTNTIFDSGESTLEEMIASIDYGYLLEGMESGMEDPKHWGIQCIIALGYEIRDGKLTGKTVTPMVLTGYVPDLLGNISMASGDVVVDGCGYCGKGYKEWVKVADGGPYLKTKVRLG